MKAQKANSVVALTAMVLVGVAAVVMIVEVAKTPDPKDATENLKEQIEGLDITPAGTASGN